MTQDECDGLWENLCTGGHEVECGWLTDKFGQTWQIVPSTLGAMLAAIDTAASQRVLAALMRMKKFDRAALDRAYRKRDFIALQRRITMDNNPVGWFEIYVQDINRAKTFYESVFQVTLSQLNSPGMDMWAFPMAMDRPGASGALVKMQGVPSGGNSTLVYFSCADCAVEAARVVKAGGKIDREKMSIGDYGFIALAVDTEGNMLGLHSML